MTSQKLILLILLSSTFLAGKSSFEIHEPKRDLIDFRVHLQDSSGMHQKWAKAMNADGENLQHLYTDQAIKICEDSTLTAKTQIAAHYWIKKLQISEIKSLFAVEAHKGRGISYEIISYVTSDSRRISQLVIYETHNNQKLRAFEFEETQNKSLDIEIAKLIEKQLLDRRKQWMAYCNSHQVDNLVNDLYSSNTLYFNQRPLVKGKEALIKEYGYMNNERYTLSLHPEMTHTVNDSTVIEIGQCKGSYGGKYILVWKKEDDGQWRIFIDSNI